VREYQEGVTQRDFLNQIHKLTSEALQTAT
jgi:hypothetical protein